MARAGYLLLALALLLLVISSVDAGDNGKPHENRRHPQRPHQGKEGDKEPKSGFRLPRHRRRPKHPGHPPGHRHRGHLRLGRHHRVRVRTACHGRSLYLACHGGYRLRILAAFYGWASRHVCPTYAFRHGRAHSRKGGHQQRCAAKGAAARVRRECKKRRRHCRLKASSRLFGKPCGKKQRPYLRVLYACVFHGCKRVTWVQAKVVKLIARYRKLAKGSYGYWRRRHYRRRGHRLQRKLNRLRRKFHFCFKCRRGCVRLRRRLARLKHADAKIRTMMSKLKKKKPAASKKGDKRRHHRVRWHASRWFLRRKLAYIRARGRKLKRLLRRCMRACRY